MSSLVVKNKLLPIFIIVLGALVGYYILYVDDQKPANDKQDKVKRLRIVQTSELVNGSVVPFWESSGFVIPAESVKVYAQVSGNIEAINPLAMPGGQLKKGQWLAKLETVDFELALQSQQAQ